MAQAGTQELAMTMIGNDESFACRTGQSLLDAMIAARRTGIKVGCRNGGCGVCRVWIAEGRYQSGKMSRSRISEADEQDRVVLACRIFPETALSFEARPLTGGSKSLGEPEGVIQ